MVGLLRVKCFRRSAYRFRYFLLFTVAAYGFIMLLDSIVSRGQIRKKLGKVAGSAVVRMNAGRVGMAKSNTAEKNFHQSNLDNAISLYSSTFGEIMIENILGEDPEEVRRRMTPPNVTEKGFKVIALDGGVSGISNDNMGGCKEWKCTIRSQNLAQKPTPEAFLLSSFREHSRQNSDHYFVFFSQESAANYFALNQSYNFSLNFLRNSPTSSPYGYTVKLAEASRPTELPISEDIIQNKKMPIAWFVSNCGTYSMREEYVSYLKNSICRDYITEKLWKHGYQHNIIPIVLKRSIIERYVPPHSFIAVDDFKNVRDLADYLKYLMKNTSAYREYFEWRRQYKVLFLNGVNHDQLERPWGFCQLCRMLWMKPRPKYEIKNFNEFWSNSCEQRGELVKGIIQEERKLYEKSNLMRKNIFEDRDDNNTNSIHSGVQKKDKINSGKHQETSVL